MEFVTFEQINADRQPEHCCILPFTRNAIGPMDFTPVVFNPKARQVTRRTSDAFELALAVVFQSGVQHYGLTPADVDAAPEFVVSALKSLSPVWDDVKFLDGYPGRYVVMARRNGQGWFVAGINGSTAPVALNLDLSFVASKHRGEVAAGLRGELITEGAGGHGFVSRHLSGESAKGFKLTLPAHGGFLLCPPKTGR